MIRIIHPEYFKTIPWKNGLGTTLELAINDGGTLDDFDWRLSIASVVEDGPFSDFSDYNRTLILIEGAGISLEHDKTSRDTLSAPLERAMFDGAAKTVGTLISGPIKDFNIMTRKEKYQMKVGTYKNRQDVEVEPCEHYFAYSLTDDTPLTYTTEQTKHVVPSGALLHIKPSAQKIYQINGQDLIVIHISTATA